MFTRIFSGAVLLTVLAACDSAPDNSVLAEAEERAKAQAGDDGRISCAVNGAADFQKACETERISGPDGTTLIIRHSDGGFRRFQVLTDGQGLQPADGSEDAQIQIVEDNLIEVTVGSDKYRLPAKVKASADQATTDAGTQAASPE